MRKKHIFMLKQYHIFIDFLRFCISSVDEIPDSLKGADWKELYAIARKQALVGIMFEGVKRLPQELWPPRNVILQWAMMVESIKLRNRQTTDVCLRLTEAFSKDGFETCILKGQANHVYYDGLNSEHSLGPLRICGDVDAWIWPKEKTLHPVKSIIVYCQSKKILLSLCHLHAEVKPVNGVPVEIHFRPSFLNAPWSNLCFQKLFKSAVFENKEIDECGTIKKLRVDYDLIFQMNHIYRHLLDEGVGMRQILDFYVLLKAYQNERQGQSEIMNVDVLMKHISDCGMKRFASALMFVLQKIFGLDDEELLCPVSEKHGEFLMEEMMAAGNFGHYDERMKTLAVKNGKLSYQLQKAQRRFKRNLRFLTSYPEEVICEPFARIYHFIWRKLALYRF